MKIFIVEDDPMFAEILRSNIAMQDGIEAEVFANGEAMIENMYKNPEIVFLDYYLDEDLDGLDVLRKIKEFNSNISVIFISGQEKTEVAIDSLKFGAADYIIKNEEAVVKALALLDKIKQVNIELKKQQRGKWMKRASFMGLFTVLSMIVFIKF